MARGLAPQASADKTTRLGATPLIFVKRRTSFYRKKTMPNGGGRAIVLQRLWNRRRPAMKRQRLLFAAAAAGLAIVAVASMQIPTSSTVYCAPKDEPKRVLPQTSQSKKSFREDVVPIFVGRCVSCHQPNGEGTAKSGLDLTSYAGVM